MIVLLAALTACAKPAERRVPQDELKTAAQYQAWADGRGYASGMLTDVGAAGLYQDVFATLPGTPGYDSGRIVIGDSRCCQLGIWEQRAGAGDFAVFAVWGGHNRAGEPSIANDDMFERIAACFRAQVKKRGGCEIFFFATVNDYDPGESGNETNIAAAIAFAERLAAMKSEHRGGTVSPDISVIGVEGCGGGRGAWLDPASFNVNITDYNAKLLEAVGKSELLKSGLSRFTTVREIVRGEPDFIDDGLHYGDKTLLALADRITGRK